MTRFIWKEEQVPSHLTVKQVYAIAFTDDKRVILQGENDKYNLTGGKPKMNETYIETLKREYYEELNIIIDDIYYLGYLLVCEPNAKTYAQVRMIAKIKSIGENRPDLDNGKLYKRFLVNLDNTKKYLNYKGKAGNLLIDSAIKMANEKYKFGCVNTSEDFI